MTLDLRPLTLGELLDRSFSLYRTHIRTAVAIMALPAGIAGVMRALVQVSSWNLQTAAASGAATPSLAAALIPGALALVLLIPAILVNAMAVAAISALVADIYQGRVPTARAALARVRARLGKVLLVLLLTVVRLFGMMFLAALVAFGLVILAGLTVRTLGPIGPALGGVAAMLVLLCAAMAVVFLMLRYSLALPVVILEEAGASEAIQRSIALTRGHLPRALAIVGFGLVISQIVALLMQTPFTIAAMAAGLESPLSRALAVAGIVGGTLANAVTAPLTSVALSLLYYDARMRHEALDLHMMLDALDGPAQGMDVRPSAAWQS